MPCRRCSSNGLAGQGGVGQHVQVRVLDRGRPADHGRDGVGQREQVPDRRRAAARGGPGDRRQRGRDQRVQVVPGQVLVRGQQRQPGLLGHRGQRAGRLAVALDDQARVPGPGRLAEQLARLRAGWPRTHREQQGVPGRGQRRPGLVDPDAGHRRAARRRAGQQPQRRGPQGREQLTENGNLHPRDRCHCQSLSLWPVSQHHSTFSGHSPKEALAGRSHTG